MLSSYYFSAMKPVADAKKPSSGSNLTDGIAPSQTGCTTKSNMFFSLLPAACCAFMLYSSVTAIVDSHGDPSTVFFVVSSLSILGLLYLCMREFERAVAVKDDKKRDRLTSLPRWILRVIITCLFFIPATDKSPIEASKATDIHPQVLSSPFSYYISAMKPVADAKKPSPGSNLTDGVGPAQTGCTTKSNMFFSLLPAACFALMLYCSFTAIVDSHGDPSTVFFVVSSLSILGLLYLSMREFESAVAVKDDQKRDHPLKMAIWSLAVLLNILFSYRVTSVLQSPVMTRIIWTIAAAASLLGIYLLYFLAPPVPPTTNKEDTQRGCLKMSIWPLAMHLNLLFSYVVTSVLQSPVMTGVIWGLAAVTSRPLASSREGAPPRWILRVIITGLGFIPATAGSIQLPIEASSATDIHPQVLSSPSIALVVCLVIAFPAFVYMIKKLETPGRLIVQNVLFLCGCSFFIVLVTLEFHRAVITNDLIRINFLKIIIISLSMLLTSRCTHRASSVLQVGMMTAGAWAMAEIWFLQGPPF